MFDDNFKKTANLEITTVVGCPVMCSFCPQHSLISQFKILNKNYIENKILDFDKFKIILDKVPNWVDIHFSGMSEPYAAKDCTKMMKYAINKGHKICVYTTLVGATKEDIEFLSTVSFNTKYKLVIHLPDDEKNFKAKVTEKYIENLRFLLSVESIQNGIINGSIDFMSMSRRGLTDPIIANLIPKKLSSFVAISRANNLSNKNEKYEGKQIISRKNGSIICSVAPQLNHNVLLPNGDVVLCCMDYSIKHNIGNLLTNDYESLFQGEQLKIIFSEMQKDNNTDSLLCRNCEFAKEI